MRIVSRPVELPGAEAAAAARPAVTISLARAGVPKRAAPRVLVWVPRTRYSPAASPAGIGKESVIVFWALTTAVLSGAASRVLSLVAAERREWSWPNCR